MYSILVSHFGLNASSQNATLGTTLKSEMLIFILNGPTTKRTDVSLLIHSTRLSLLPYRNVHFQEQKISERITKYLIPQSYGNDTA